MKKLIVGSTLALLLGASIAASASSRTTIRSGDSFDGIVAGDVEATLKKCAACHGADFKGKGKTPAIAGWAKDKIMEKLTTKVPKQMAAVVKGLSDADKTAAADAISKKAK